ncbi:hypothetical protein D3C78_1243200 [compost metagenome]
MEKVDTIVHIKPTIIKLIIVRSWTFQKRASGSLRRLIVHIRIRRSPEKYSIIEKSTKITMMKITGSIHSLKILIWRLPLSSFLRGPSFATVFSLVHILWMSMRM